MTPHEQVLAMVQAGTISEADGQRLLDALRNRPATWTMLFAPFDRLSAPVGWLVATAVIVASLGLSRLDFRFDGALDLHLSEMPSWTLALFDQANAIVVTAALFWIASLAVARRGRLVDFVLAVALARAPLPLLGVWIFVMYPPVPELAREVAAGVTDPRVLLGSVLAIPLLGWFVALLYRGFAVASGLKGTRAGVTFTIALLAAEVATKLLLTFFHLGVPLPTR